MSYQRIRIPSLEVGWLARRDKQLPSPAVIFAEELSVAGLYIPPWSGGVIEEGIEIPPSNGTIVVGEWDGVIPHDAIIAHEWRHHWQWWNGWDYDGIGWEGEVEYWDLIFEYFTKSHSEADALKFQAAMAPCDFSDFIVEYCDLIS